MNKQNIIKIEDLTKIYYLNEKKEGLKNSIKQLIKKNKISKTAIRNFSIEISCGECIGLIGPNGAGKTTLIKLMTGIIAPTEGEINVMGFNPNKLETEFKKKIALVSGQKSQLYFDLTASDSFRLFKEIYDIDEKSYKHSLKELVDILDVGALLDQPIRNLSLGERMKMEIIAALIHNPPILFLDEPTIGLDCISQNKLRNYLQIINDIKKTTIILTSHDFSDIETLCNRCVVLNKGRKLNDASVSELIQKFNQKKVITIYSSNLYNVKKILEDYGYSDTKKTSDRLVLNILPSELEKLYGIITKIHDIWDISVENEEISNIIERIYDNNE